MANEMKEKFDNAIRELLSNKREDNNAYMNSEEHFKKIETVKKTMTDYRLVRKYNIMTISGTERLIRPVNEGSETVLYYVTTEDLFKTLEEAHVAVGHGGRNRMTSELKKKYCNVTAE